MVAAAGLMFRQENTNAMENMTQAFIAMKTWANMLHPADRLPPSLQHDLNRHEDVLKADADGDAIGGDDATDALRYLVAYKPRILYVRRLAGFC